MFKIGVSGEVGLNQNEFEVLTLNLLSACFPTQVIAASLLLGITLQIRREAVSRFKIS